MRRLSAALLLSLVLLNATAAQETPVPTARLVSAPRLDVPGAVDSNVPMLWDLVDGSWRLFALASWGGIPSLLAGPSVDRLQREVDAVTFTPLLAGMWIEAVLTDDGGTWYAYYHQERSADECGRADRFIPRIGSAKSIDRGRTWTDLGIVLEAAADTHACSSANRFVVGGVGDLSVMLTPDGQDLYLFFSQYFKDRGAQGVAVARMAWADRDEPVGRLAIWNDGAWLVPEITSEATEETAAIRRFPAGTPLASASKPWHDGDPAADVYWGPSVHWNEYLHHYVMLLNRTKNEGFDNEGIYVSYARSLDDPRSWSAPRKLMSGGGWYPQVAGLDPQVGTDKHAGARARFFLTGKSDRFIEFSR